MSFVVLAISAFVFSIVAVKISRRVATHYKIGSLPTPRKIHKEFKPVLGGLGIFLGVILGVLFSNLLNIIPWSIWSEYRYFWMGLFVIVITGLLDDVLGLNSLQKFLGEGLAALLPVLGGCVIEAYVAPGGATLSLGRFSFPFSLLWIIFIINAVNLLDGLDGLAAGVCLICIVGFAFFTIRLQNISLLLLALAFCFSTLGFLKYNYHPASVFMGDVGSLQLGYLLAFLSIETLKVAGSHQVYFLSSLVILGVPITDTLISFLRRLSRGEHPFKADMEHIHHRLISLGLSHLQTVWLLYLFGFIFTLTAILMVIYSEFAGLVLFVLAFAFALFWAWRLGYFEARRTVSFGFLELDKIAPLRTPIHWNRLWHKVAIFISDILSINLALYFTIWFKFKSGLLHPLPGSSFEEFFTNPVFLLFTIAWILLFWVNGLYSMPWDVSRFDKSFRMIKIITFGILVIGFLTADLTSLGNRTQISTLGFYWANMVILVVGLRLIVIEIEKRYRLFEYSLKNSLIIGANRKARNIIRDIKSNPHLLYHVVGIVEKKWSHVEFEGLPVVGEFKDLPDLIQQYKIEEVIIALNEKAREVLLRIIGMCDQLQVVIKTLPGLHKLVSGRSPELAGHALVKIFPDNMVLWQWLVKRALDWAFAFGNLLLFLPIWSVLAVLVKWEFRSSVFVTVPALGKNGRVFSMYLFRMTESDYDYNRNVLYLGRGNPKRLSPLGKFLYHTKLYKFPLILNILKGDMSLVGPRPEPLEWYQKHHKRLQFMHRRLMVRPGFTGLAQIKYRYEFSQKVLQERVNYDIYYIENLSLGLDLRIILRSLFLFFLKSRKQMATTS